MTLGTLVTAAKINIVFALVLTPLLFTGSHAVPVAVAGPAALVPGDLRVQPADLRQRGHARPLAPAFAAHPGVDLPARAAGVPGRFHDHRSAGLPPPRHRLMAAGACVVVACRWAATGIVGLVVGPPLPGAGCRAARSCVWLCVAQACARLGRRGARVGARSSAGWSRWWCWAVLTPRGLVGVEPAGGGIQCGRPLSSGRSSRGFEAAVVVSAEQGEVVRRSVAAEPCSLGARDGS